MDVADGDRADYGVRRRVDHVIHTATNAVIGTIAGGNIHAGLAVTPDGSKVYVANYFSNTVSVIATATNTVVGVVVLTDNTWPDGLAVTPDGSKVYVTNRFSNDVSVIDTATNTMIGLRIPVGTGPAGVAVTPDGKHVYVANFDFDLGSTVSVIDTATNTVTAAISVGFGPLSFGIFIQPASAAPKFAGTPGKSNRHGQSVSALAQQY